MDDLSQPEIYVLLYLRSQLENPRAYTEYMSEYVLRQSLYKSGITMPQQRVATTLLEGKGLIKIENKSLAGRNEFRAYTITGKGLQFLDNRSKPQPTTRLVSTKKEILPKEDTTYHPLIETVTKDSLNSKLYRNAVHDAYIAAIQELKTKMGHPKKPNGKEMDGDALVRHAFGGERPKLFFIEKPNAADRDFQKAVEYLWLSIVNFRNEKSHQITEIKERHLAECHLAIASLALSYLEKTQFEKK